MLEDLLAFAQASVERPAGKEQAHALSECPTDLLLQAAQIVTRRHASGTFNFCAIVNAKSGRCSENCAWCAQSRHFKSHVAEYPLIEPEEALAAAKKAQESGSSRFSLVTSRR